MSDAVPRVVGQQGMEGQFEEAVQRLSAGVDGCNTCRSQDDELLPGMFGDIAEERRFTRPCFAGQEKRATGELYNLKSLLPLLVVKVELFLSLVHCLGSSASFGSLGCGC